MTDQNKTEIVCILDRSGSMGSIWGDAIGGMKAFIEEQRKAEGSTNITIVVFDDRYLEIANGIDIHRLETKILDDIFPRSSTSLLDAIGKTINTVGKRLKDTEEKDRPENVVFCILTDGMENSSREFTSSQIKKMIEHQTDKYNWTFTYLGANQDAFAVGKEMGIAGAMCANVEASTGGMLGSYRAYSRGVNLVRKKKRQSVVMQELVDEKEEE